MTTATADHTACQAERSSAECEFLSDIVITALEGGIGYWSQARAYHWWSVTLDGGSADHLEGKSNAYASIREVFDEEVAADGGPWLEIDLDVVAAGIEALLAPGFSIRTDIAATTFSAKRALDAGMIDADIADCIVQAGLFGEVRYG